jgi:acyl-CoA thioester hydrolase
VRGEGELAVEVRPLRLGTSSLIVGGRVCSVAGDVIHADGETRIVRLDPATFRPAPWSDRVRGMILPLLPA